jgi:hypothetical protein
VHGWHLLIKIFIQFIAAQVRGAGLVIDAGKASDMSFISSKRTGRHAWKRRLASFNWSEVMVWLDP